MKRIGIPVRNPNDFDPHPAGSLFRENNACPQGAIFRVEYLKSGHSTLVARRLLVFYCTGSSSIPCYYYAPIHKPEKAVRKEVLVILDLLRVGGEDVADDVKVDLK